AGKAAARLENRNSRSANASIAKHGGSQFCGQSGARDPRAPARCAGSRDEPAIDRAATGRGGSAQRGKAGRERGPEVNDELWQSLLRCEIGVGKIHVLVDARAIEFRDAVFSRPVHGQTGWNGMVLFITRDSSDINAADEFARGRIFFNPHRYEPLRIDPAAHFGIVGNRGTVRLRFENLTARSVDSLRTDEGLLFPSEEIFDRVLIG